jgi:hypothetical protein
MANLVAIEAALGGLPSAQKVALMNAFREIIKGMRFGRPVDGHPAENFAGGFYAAVTPSVAGEEFSIAHDFGIAPYLVVPVLDVRTVGLRTVPLAVSRVADARRVYLTSTVADAPVILFVEG